MTSTRRQPDEFRQPTLSAPSIRESSATRELLEHAITHRHAIHNPRRGSRAPPLNPQSATQIPRHRGRPRLHAWVRVVAAARRSWGRAGPRRRAGAGRELAQSHARAPAPILLTKIYGPKLLIFFSKFSIKIDFFFLSIITFNPMNFNNSIIVPRQIH